ncbi:MAG: dUTP diphosphatase [Candidatus Cloacimonetes bacterium]|nr:dUTP diphosphatase [Candidatus Cloacimonadota bacterium]
MMIKIKIKKLTESAEIPKQMSEHASGFDLTADLDEPVELASGAILLIPTGLALSMPSGYEAQVRPRSGLAIKHGIGVLNSPGTIDADYRGEIKVILFNFGSEPFVIEPKMRIAQMVFQQVIYADMQIVDELDETERGAGGFGHTRL